MTKERQKILLFYGLFSIIEPHKMPKKQMFKLFNSFNIPTEYLLLYTTPLFSGFISGKDIDIKINIDKWAKSLNTIENINYPIFHCLQHDTIVKLIPKIKKTQVKYRIIDNLTYFHFHRKSVKEEMNDNIFLNTLKEIMQYVTNRYTTMDDYTSITVSKLFMLKKTLNYEKGLDFLNYLQNNNSIVGRTYIIRSYLINYLVKSAHNKEEREVIIKGEKSSYCINSYNNNLKKLAKEKIDES